MNNEQYIENNITFRKEFDEDKSKHKIINIQEEEDEIDDDSDITEKLELNSKAENSQDSITDSLDEERYTLSHINRLAEKASKKKKPGFMHFLNKKSGRDYEPITYDEKMRKIVKIFCGTKEELNEFLVHCQIQKMSFEDCSPLLINNPNIIYFEPKLWLKSNKIEKRNLSFEDLSIYCQNKIPQENNIIDNIENHNIKNLIEGNNNKLSYLTKNKKVYNNYIELQKIISCKALNIEQKNWLNSLFQEINNIDINDITIEKDEKGKENKLEIVFDLDNTCIFSFLSNPDIIYVQSKKNIFPQKEVKMISFNFNNKVLYCVLIIRKELKEFMQYVEPLCNFHISTLGAENYGKEILGILSNYSNVKFIRFKGRSYNNELIKNIADLYIEKEKTIIFDDNMRVWNNRKRDYENVIISKFFFDEECILINNSNGNIGNDPLYEIDLFLNSYKSLFYNKIRENRKNGIDWKEQQIMEHPNIPFYQFKTANDFNYNKCFTAEYLTSKKYQFSFMKNVIKQIYYLRFVYNINIPLCIKLIRIATLSNMKFDLKYLTIDQKEILTEMIKVCGGIIFDNNYMFNDEKIYLIASTRLYGLKPKKEEIKKDLVNNPYYVLLNEKFILDTYYFMTNLKEYINDSEYTFNDNDYND